MSRFAVLWFFAAILFAQLNCKRRDDSSAVSQEGFTKVIGQTPSGFLGEVKRCFEIPDQEFEKIRRNFQAWLMGIFQASYVKKSAANGGAGDTHFFTAFFVRDGGADRNVGAEKVWSVAHGLTEIQERRGVEVDIGMTRISISSTDPATFVTESSKKRLQGRLILSPYFYDHFEGQVKNYRSAYIFDTADTPTRVGEAVVGLGFHMRSRRNQYDDEQRVKILETLKDACRNVLGRTEQRRATREEVLGLRNSKEACGILLNQPRVLSNCLTYQDAVEDGSAFLSYGHVLAQDDYTFITNLDNLPGASGGPVIRLRDGKVIGTISHILDTEAFGQEGVATFVFSGLTLVKKKMKN